MIFALAGNQNCGKTTLFNQLTGSNQHVGNFPGVTVERKDGVIRGHKDAMVVDLPGIYSLSPYTNEEIVTRDFLLNGHPDGVINIIDATNIERNLYLSLQLIELNLPMVIALNMMDEVRANGGTIDIVKLQDEIGVPVVPISASKNEGVEELIQTSIATASAKQRPKRMDFCTGAVHRAIHAIAHLVEDHAERINVPARFAATKLVEGDAPMMEALQLSDNEKDMLEHSVTEMEHDLGTDREAALADMRYTFIERLCADAVVKNGESKGYLRSVKIDSILTHKFLAIPIFLLIMMLVFWLTFGVIGSVLNSLLSLGIDALTDLVSRGLLAYGINPVVHSLVIDGVFAGVGSVLSFLPTIVVLFHVYPGGQRVYGARRLCHGQAPAQNRAVRPQFCADAYRFWLFCARNHGNQDAFQRARPQDDDTAYAVHELQRKAADLRRVYHDLFSALQRPGYDTALCHGDFGRHFVRPAAEKLAV